jgi:hypothetical protein
MELLNTCSQDKLQQQFWTSLAGAASSFLVQFATRELVQTQFICYDLRNPYIRVVCFYTFFWLPVSSDFSNTKILTRITVYGRENSVDNQVEISDCITYWYRADCKQI